MKTSIRLATALFLPLSVLALPLPTNSPCHRSSLTPDQLQDIFNHRPITVSLSTSTGAAKSITIDPSPPPSAVLASERPMSTEQLLALPHRHVDESVTEHNPAAAAPSSALPALREWEVQHMRVCRLAMDDDVHFSSQDSLPPASSTESLIGDLHIGFVNIVVPGELLLLCFLAPFLLAILAVEVATRISKM